MAFLDQNPPSFDNQLEYDKWVAEQLKAADEDQDRQDEEFKKDQERQDQEIEDLKESLNACTGRAEELTCIGLHVVADADTWPVDGEWSYDDSPYVNQIFVATSWLEDVGKTPDVVDKVWINEVEYQVLSAGMVTSNALGRDCFHITYEPKIPDEITSGNENIRLSLCPPGYDFVTRPEFEEDQQRQDEHTESLMDEVAGEINALREDICYYDFNFNYKLIQDTDPQPGECAVPFDDPVDCQMFRLHRTQLDGTVVDTTEVHVDDIIYFEQNLGDWIEYEILRVDDLGPDHFQISVNYLSHGNNNLKSDPPKYYWDRPCLIYEKKADFDPCDKVTHEEFAKDQKRQDDALEAEIEARAERDLTHDAQLNTLEYKLDQLVGLTFKGTYEFKHEADCDAAYQQCIADCWDNDPDDHNCRTECGREMSACETDKVRAGFFEAVDPDDQFDHLEQIIISKSDQDGVELDWSGVLDEGDYLEVDHSLKGELDKRNYGLYRITEEPEHTQNSVGEDVYVIKLQFLQGDGALAEGEMFEIRGITAAEGVNPEELGDFLTKDEAANLYALKDHNHDDRYHKRNTTNGGNYFVTANHQEVLKSDYHVKGSNKYILLNDHTAIAQSNFSKHDHTHTEYLDKNTTDSQTINSSITGKYFYGQSSTNNSGFMTRQKILEAIEANGGGSVSDTDFVKNGNSSAITITKTSGVYYISGG